MKVNRLKKMLSVMLAAAMLVSSIPLGSSAGEADTAGATEGTEVAASKETEKDTDAENKEVSGETTPASSENAQNPSSGDTEGQNTQPVEEPNGSNSAQEASGDNVQSTPQGGETASNPDNSTGEKKKENTPAKTSTFAPLEAPTEVTLDWTGVTLKKEWNNEGQKIDGSPTTNVETGVFDPATLEYTYAVDGTGTLADGLPKDVGTYKVTAKVPSDKETDITLKNETQTFEITKRTISTLIWNCSDSQIYNGNAIKEPEATFFSDVEASDKKLSVTCTDSESKDVEINAIKNAGTYTLTAELEDADKANYEIICDKKKTIEIKKCEVTLVWTDDIVPYDATEHELSFSVGENNQCSDHNAEDLKGKIKLSYEGQDGKTKFTNAGSYVATATIDDTNHTIAEGSATHTLTIGKLGDITLTPKMPDGSEDLTKVYDNKKTIFSAYETKLEDPLKTELQGLLGSVNESLFDYGSENVSEEHPFTLSDAAKTALENSNFDPEGIKVAGTFTITKREITVTPSPEQWKYYGADDLVLAYTVDDLGGGESIADTEIKKEEIEKAIADAGGLSRVSGEDIGQYEIDAPKGVLTNFTVTVNPGVNFEIKALPVTIHPKENQWKLFGQEEPTSYLYTVEITTNQTKIIPSQVEAVLGTDGLTRVQGEGVGEYNFQIIPEDSDLYKNKKLYNYDFTVLDNPKFEIKKITIIDVQKIDSRQDSFKVETNLDVPRQPGVTTSFKVEIVEYPKEANGINYSSSIDDYITNATSGVPFTGDSDKLKINTVEYSKERKDNKKLVKWNGYLPAGTKIAVSIVDADGNEVSDGKTVVTVSPVNVSFDWSGFETSAVTGNYVTANKGAANPLSLTGSREGEWVEIVYNGKATDYGALNMQFTPTPQNANSKHVTQSVTANIVDTLNLVCESKSLQFYVDDSAFSIPASSIRFENRGEDITIQLPEQGTLTEVSILDGKVELSGDMGQEFTLPVSWSGKNLIPTGAPISITYTDQAGHQGSGIAAASRSTVSTPITFRIRPELNINGYLNGRSDMLIVSGTACSCEPIRITVAGATQTTYATQKEVWSDSNGSWEAMFSMGSLPEDQDFTISAEYVDVNGQGYSISAKFDAFCASPSVVSPIYEAMSYISGMVEPGTAVALVLNGDSQNYYEIQVDRFGHFVMDDVPMMFGGEDSFDIYVTDIAGNVSIRHYEVEEPGDPFEVTGKVNPLGKFLYSASESDSITLAATPVSTDDFDEKKTDIEIPLLMGMSYEVGTLTLHKTENGFTVSKEIKMDEEIATEDYRFENEKLYVYTSRPSIEELKSASGQEAAYGTEIPLGEDETVWIVSESDMTILADDVMELKQFDFENSEEYVKYQEK